MLISLYGHPAIAGGETPEALLLGFLDELREGGAGDFENGPPYPITVDGAEGVAVDLSGTMFDMPIKGQALVVMPSEHQLLYGIAIGNVEDGDEIWLKTQQVLAALLDSVEFIPSGPFEGSLCPVSSDKTYGYSKDNPIRVGGGAFEGPARERAYLDALSGPNGEPVEYERSRSVNHNDTILDEYIIHYGDNIAILYLDEYSYEDPKAPQGLACWTTIPLSEP